MAKTKSEAIFESLNLNPQLFINEAFNIVDDRLDEAFNYFLNEASDRLKIEGTDRYEELSKGVASIQNSVQLTVDQRLEKWEEYCLRFCFTVPDEFCLPNENKSSESELTDGDALADTQLDAELNSLREKLSLVGKDTAELARELRALEGQSSSNNKSAESINEALLLYNKHNTAQTFQEFTAMASELRTKVGNLKRIIDEAQHGRSDRARFDVVRMCRGNGLFGAKLDEVEEFLDEVAK